MTPENKRHIKCQLEKKGKDWGIVFFEISFGSTSFRGSLFFPRPGAGDREVVRRGTLGMSLQSAVVRHYNLPIMVRASQLN